MLIRLWWRYRNLRRLAQILRVALGMLWSLAIETGWRRNFLSPNQKPLGAVPASPYRHVCQAMEKLGPTFIKLGQFLSARPDLIPPELALELEKLQDKVLPLPAEEVRAQFRKSFGMAPEELFCRFDYEPLAGASIAQVHKGVLKDGQEVAVKIQRPSLRNLAQEDLSILRNNKRRIARSFPGRLIDIEEVIDDLSRKILRELDFTNEASNMDIFRGLLRNIAGVTVPVVHWEYTTKEILVMDYIPGVKAEELSREARCRAARLLLQSLLTPIFQEGIFHGDPHPGNILFQGDGQIAWVDFGSVGRLDEAFRRRMLVLLVAVDQRDAAKVAELTLEWGQVVGPYNPSHLYEDTAVLLDKVSGLGKENLDLGNLMLGMMDISLTHHIRLPETFLLLGKTLLAGEGHARRLDPDVNLMEIALPLANAQLQEKLLPKLEQEDLYLQSLIYKDSLPNLYRQTGQVLANLAQGQQRVVFSHQGLEPLGRSLEKAAQYIVTALVFGAVLVTFGTRVTLDGLNPWAIPLGMTVIWLSILVLVKICWK